MCLLLWTNHDQKEIQDREGFQEQLVAFSVFSRLILDWCPIGHS